MRDSQKARLYLGEIEYDLAKRFSYGSKNPRKGYRQEEYWKNSMRRKYEIPEHITDYQVRQFLETLAERLRCKRKV